MNKWLIKLVVALIAALIFFISLMVTIQKRQDYERWTEYPSDFYFFRGEKSQYA